MAVPVFKILFKCLINNFVLLLIWDSYGKKKIIWSVCVEGWKFKSIIAWHGNPSG